MLKINRILCPIDISSEADNALRYAVALAQAYAAKLFVCHCVESLVTEEQPQILTRIYEDTISLQIEEKATGALDIKPIVIEGDPSEMITKIAAERGIDLIVMTSRRRPLAAALLGSTAEAVCRTSPCPVLVLHQEEREWLQDSKPEIKLKKILIAHDFSNDAEIALKYASSLAQEYQAELHLVHVLPVLVSPAVSRLPLSLEVEYQRATQMLKQSAPEEFWCSIKQAVLTGLPYREILSYAEENQIDLICMGVHGAGFSMRALFGSNSDRVLRQAPCPVLLTRPLKSAISIQNED